MEFGSDFTLCIHKETTLFYVSGRVAIKKVLKTICVPNDMCLIPNYLCDTIFNCFEHHDFYTIKDNLQIDFEYLKNAINMRIYKVIFIINFFGNIDDNIVNICELCRLNNIIVIEDFTHNLYSNRLYGDICICSYRKSLGTPYGCIVIDSNKLLNIEQNIYIDSSYLYCMGMKIIGMFFKNIYYLKWLWYPLLVNCELNINNVEYVGFDYVNYLLYKYYYDNDNKFTRMRNYKYLNTNLKYKSILEYTSDELYFTYPIMFETTAIRDSIRQKCINHNIYCPIYWTLNFDKYNKCNTNISSHILCVPIDQRYNIHDLKKICEYINNCNNNENVD